ncbi:hypothetical protein CCUS01_02669 [Colletotrichum cuscutae]|uniref:Uncharacterized protein n=1 Tax=Colletotrichum cuscutae TaxID=1209917 RepID=A0AAJ0DQE1_9PEZI|nr:hypothetical protein CCUS01_02669 [Colletotrichum cuscutae]
MFYDLSFNGSSKGAEATTTESTRAKGKFNRTYMRTIPFDIASKMVYIRLRFSVDLLLSASTIALGSHWYGSFMSYLLQIIHRRPYSNEIVRIGDRPVVGASRWFNGGIYESVKTIITEHRHS